MRFPAWLLMAGWFGGTFVIQSEPVLRVHRGEHDIGLLQNGGFEEIQGDKAADWRPAAKGCRVVAGEGRNDSRGLVCENVSGEGWFGASQTVQLNRTTAAPLTVRGWSKAFDVAGGSDSGYSLYVDLTYADGTPLWGQTITFRAGTHDWERRHLVISPEKPVRSVTVHCLFRGHAGKVWFDDIELQEAVQGTSSFLFQGVAVEAVASGPSSGSNDGAPETVTIARGLRLAMAGQTITSLQAGLRTFRDEQGAGFMARDVGADSDFAGFTGNKCPELNLGLETRTFAQSNHIVVEGRVSDLTGKDRAITLVFAVPLQAGGWHWGDDIRRDRVISGRGEFANQVSVRCGATGTQSLYPMAAVWDKETGVALALDMERPAVYRVGYHAGLERLFIAYDFALVKETEAFPSSAGFRFVLFTFDAAQGYRGAWGNYTEIFPDCFAVRSKDQGLWMPFTDVSKVAGWQDFGFRYHEGDNNVAWDDDHGILSFRYTEPMTWWMRMAKGIPRTLPEALRIRDNLAQAGGPSQMRMAQVTRLAAMHDEAGEPALLFRNEPWTDGAVWSLNPQPWLGMPPAGAKDGSDSAAQPIERGAPTPPVNAATVYWNDAIKARLYGRDSGPQLDGEYLDSLEGYVTAELNFRRDHFPKTTVPLCFSTETRQPVLFKGLTVYEFTRWLAQDVHRLNKLMFANGVPYRFTYLCPWLDVLGTETDWLQDGKYHPASLATMDLWRTLAGAKPYLLLMNTDYDKFTPELVERYFHRALFYGMWPGFFSHNAADNPYWQTPRWYERDRPLFQKYLPLIKRVAEAGWQPVPHASCPNPHLLIERFGPAAGGKRYLTLFNESAEVQAGCVALESKALGASALLRPQPLLGSPPERTPLGWQTRLDPERAAVWELVD